MNMSFRGGRLSAVARAVKMIAACALISIALQNFRPTFMSARADSVATPPNWAMEGMATGFNRVGEPDVQAQLLLFHQAAELLSAAPAADRSALIDVLIKRLGDIVWDVRQAAASALGTLARDDSDKKNAAIDALIKRLDDTDWSVMQAAASALGTLAKDDRDKKNAAIDALINSLDDIDWHVMQAAASALGTLTKDDRDKQNAAIDELLKRLDDEFDWHVRQAAASALGTLAKNDRDKQNAAIDALIKRLDDTDWHVLQAAASALGTLAKDDRDKKNAAVDALIKRLDDDFDWQVRQAAASALGTLAKDDRGKQNAAIDALLKRLDDIDSDVRQAAASALGTLAKDDRDKQNAAIDALIKRLDDANWHVSQAAASALGTLGKDDRDKKNAAIDALLKHLDDANWHVLQAAASALGTLAKDDRDKKNAAIDALLKRLDDIEPDVRQAAASALGTLAKDDRDKKNAAIDALIKCLDNIDSDALEAAASALGTLAKDDRDKQNTAIDALIKHLDDIEPDVRQAATGVLGTLAKDDRDKQNAAIDALIKRLDDTDSVVRQAAASALGTLAKDDRGKQNAAIDALIKRLDDTDWPVRQAAADAILRLPEPPSLQALVSLLDAAEKLSFSDAPRKEAEFLVLSGGDARTLLLQPLLERTRRELAVYQDGPATLQIFADKLWTLTPTASELRRQIAWHTKNVADRICAGATTEPVHASLTGPAWVDAMWDYVAIWDFRTCLNPNVREALSKLASDFRGEKLLGEAADISRMLEDDKRRDAFAGFAWWVIWIVFVHSGFWLGLLLLYPRYRWVQVLFFWNPWVRKLLGLHLSLLIPILPVARNRLLAPFRPGLGPKPDAVIGARVAAETAWFPGVGVTEGDSTERIPVTEALPEIRGLTILEGASGLGKTVHLVRLASDPKRIVAFLKAGEEDGNVLRAIAARLPAEIMQDEAFLRSLVHAGAVNICIDGLNEVSSDVRGAIASFAQANTRANIVISTQPMRWNRPAAARILHLQPLWPDQRQAFLESREAILPAKAMLRGDAFRKRVREFLASTNQPPDTAEERLARDRALSNPMDLTTIALLLANDVEPDLLNLQEAAFGEAAERHSEVNQGSEFPLTALSEHVYELRCNSIGKERDLLVLRDLHFRLAYEALVEQRLLLPTMEPNDAGNSVPTWRFRHDKVLDYFLFIAVTMPDRISERILKHRGDPRFNGVYLLIALRAPIDVAKTVRDQINDYAVETRDHVLADEIWALIRERERPIDEPASPVTSASHGDGDAAILASPLIQRDREQEAQLTAQSAEMDTPLPLKAPIADDFG